MNRFAISSLPCLLFALACGGQPAPSEPPAEPGLPPAAEAPAAAPTPTPPPPPAPPPEPEPTAEELPVPEDFQAEVETSISAKNYKAELASLDKELKAEKVEEP